MSKKILLVEDEVLIAMNEAKTLEKHGYEVVTVYSGEKAIVTVNSDPEISLILMDIDLGKGLDGTEAAERILEKHNLPIAFLSSHTEPEVVEKTEGITSYGYILKNSGETVLIASIRMAFRLFEANNRIARSEEKHRTLFETMSPGVVYHDANGSIISANPASEKLLGLSFDQMKGKTSTDPRWKMITEEGKNVPGNEHPAMIALRTGEKVGPITRGVFVPEKESYVWLLISATPLFRPEEDKPFQVFATFEDITERKMIEKAYQESEEKYKAAFMTSPDSININRMDGLYVDINEGLTALTGYTRTDVIGKFSSEIDIWSIPEDREKLVKDLNEKGEVENLESVFRCKDGSLKTALMSARVININDEPHILSVTRDITKRKKLQEQANKANRFLENISDIAYETDNKGNITYVNSAAEKITGLSKEELTGNPLLPLFVERDRDSLMEVYRQTLKGERLENTLTFTTDVICHFTSLPRYDENGSIIGTFGVARDITERKQAEKALVEKTKLLEESQILANLGSWEWDIVHDTWVFSEQFKKIHGITDNDLATSKLLEFAHPEDLPYIEKTFSYAQEEGKPYDIEHRIIRPDNGEIRYIKTLGEVEFEQDAGSPVRLMGVSQDITERKRKEEQLKERVKELNCLYKISEFVEEPNASLNYILQQTAEVIPQSWQYPENCVCRIIVDGDIFQSTDFSETKWKLSSDIIVEGVISGEVVVCYLDEKPTIDEGPFLIEERKLLDAIAERLGRTIERYKAEEKLRSIEWMLSSKTGRKEDFIPEYGDVSSLNKDGLILTSVGKEQLKDVAAEYLDLLESSSAIYEKNGDYALGIFSSGWCRLMDTASRRLCNTENNQKALKSGKWLCHESCWRDAYLSIKEEKPVEVECNGGINMYAVPVWANDEIVGAMNFGYGNPPTEEAELNRLSERYNIPVHELKKQAKSYKPRPQFIIDYAKERIQKAAKNLGQLIERKINEEALQEALNEKDFLMKELNHRVKNNLNMVSSLISLKESETEEDLSDLKHRIQVIKTVYDKLHQKNDVEHIEVKEYFQELLESLFSSTTKGKIELVNNIADVSIPTKTAIPLGLIVNEIATNAIKYGFNSDEKERFIIELKQDEEHDQYVLNLENTGNPFPEDIGLENPESLGLQLVSTLVSQLDGTIELQKEPNPVFTIRFPVMEK